MTPELKEERASWIARQLDRDTLERSRRVREQLAAVGITLGGYRLEPALGGPTQSSEQPLASRANS